ncbi:MAG: multidrug effflux MFS transporter [Rhodovarius sp.]|nr:multidrug effflux MFS transporter [Rhodovarius sp.]
MPRFDPTAPGARLPRLLPIILGMLAAFGPLAIDMYLPALPEMAASLGGDAAAAQQTVAAYFLGVASGQMLYGPLTDRFGRRGPLLAGVGLFVLASLACAAAAGMGQMVLLRFLQALGGCAGMVVARAVVRDLAHLADPVRLMGRLMLVMGLAPILAPLIGSILAAAFGWRAIFLALAGFGGLALLLVLLHLPETHAAAARIRRSPREVLADYAALAADRRFLAPALAGGGAMAGMFAYIAGSPAVFMGGYGLSAGGYAVLFGLNAAAVIGGSQLAGPLAQRLGRPQLFGRLILGMLGVALLQVGLLAAGGGLAAQFLCLFAFLGLLGMLLPLASAMALQPFPRLAGTASALLGTLQFGLGGVAGAVLGPLQDGSGQPLAWVLLACLVLSALAWLRR